ncbi:MAG: hypothetical protein ACK4PI_12275 [Tepidisphaerales bacterium]
MATLDAIFGQDAAVSWLRSAVSAGRLPHGLLFSGPAGVGKGTTALALAGLLLCRQPRTTPALDRCGRCDSCVLLDAETHPDYRRVYRQLIRLEKDAKARDLSVDVIRDHLLIPASRTSQLGRGKVFVVEEAERMSRAAQNALLKTLEEPAPDTVIVLLTDTPGALLPTVRSRCQPLWFRPLPDELMLAELERRGVPRATAESAVRLADGSLGTALRYVEDDLLPLIDELQRQVTATLARRPGATAVGGTAGGGGGAGAAAGGGLLKFLKEAGERLADKAMQRDPDGSKDQATREALAELTRLAENGLRRLLRSARSAAGLERLCGGIEALVQARDDLESNVAVGLVLNSLVAQLETAGETSFPGMAPASGTVAAAGPASAGGAAETVRPPASRG